MDLVYDTAKSARNLRERGLPFELMEQFDFDTALVARDIRRDYGEIRYVAIGYIAHRLHVAVFMEIPTGVRIISLRKANSREVRAYEQKQTAVDR